MKNFVFECYEAIRNCLHQSTEETKDNARCKCCPFSSPVFKCENENKQPTLASDSPWSHERNLGNNANHLPCDVDPAREKQRAATALNGGKTFSQRATEVYTHTSQSWSQARCSIHHHDEALRSDQSQSVLHQCDSGGSRREGPPVPLLPRRWMQHVATLSYMSLCHSINPALGEEGKHSSSEQTRPHKHLSCASR